MLTSLARPRAFVPAILAVCIAASLAPLPALAQNSATAQAASRHYAIPAQPLASAVQQWGRVSGQQVYVNDAVSTGVTSTALSGQYTDEQALRQLLEGTGLTPRKTDGNTVIIEKTAPSAASSEANAAAVETGSLRVSGQIQATATGAERDIQGYDDVYDLDISTAYIGRTEIERYKGATPSDLLNGVAGVYSGDARNSGALDVNIRGVQGPGRVPVSIDGTEQAITAWRGYNGISNRNYIDPNLIGGMQIIKGPSQTRNVTTGIGGAVVVKTLDVDDFLADGETFGGEVKIEGSGNSVDPRLPTLYTGQDYRDVPELAGSGRNTNGSDPTLRVEPDTGDNAFNLFDGKDIAYRVALGWRPLENLDFLAAYAYRERGNYYAGEHAAGFYSGVIEDQYTDYATTMANRFKPGAEVTNSSSKMESWLFKGRWQPTDSQELRLGYRDSLSHHGEILPSRITGSIDVYTPTVDGLPQWPLSRVEAKAYNLEYTWKPQGNRWIDLYANLWRTDTRSDSYNGGPYPNYWNSNTRAYIVQNGALIHSDNDRNGLTLSNKISFTDTLDLTLGGNFQHEKLRSPDDYGENTSAWRTLPRAGRREEWQGNFNFEWRPVDFLTVTAGARYASYWAYDDFLANHEGEIITYGFTHYNASYYTRSEQDIQEYSAWWEDFYQKRIESGEYTEEQARSGLEGTIERWGGKERSIAWTPDTDGNYHRADNPCLNGSVAAAEGLVTRSSGQFCSISREGELVTASAKKRRDSGWTPAFSATAHFSDYSRIYFRYDEALRFPSLFESTLGFSSSINPYSDLKPEHVYHYELGYVHDLGHLLATDTTADIKLAYYVRKTRDLIERNNNLMFDNIDKQTVRGIEFQGRYDNGRFFTDLGIAHTLENEVCDESSAITLDPVEGRVSNCVEQGFIGSYLLTQTIPDLSATWSLGGRFLQKRLEIGGRFVYYQRRDTNEDLEYFKSVTNQNLTAFNAPYSWDTTLVVDAYANYRINESLQVELVGTNLTNQYYIDPATRSLMPAPGRTIKLSLTARF